MALFIFKYCLPALLGYTLFVGIAGRFNPFRKPFYQEERPLWILGVWTGLSVSLALGVGLHLAYGMTTQEAKSLLTPSSWFLATLLIPGFIAYFLYRKAVMSEISTAETSRFDWSIYTDNLDFNELDNENQTIADRLDPDLQSDDLDSLLIPEPETPLAATFLDSAELEFVDTASFPNAINDASDYSADTPIQDTHIPAAPDPDAPLSDTHKPEAPEQSLTPAISQAFSASVGGSDESTVTHIDPMDQTVFEAFDEQDLELEVDEDTSEDTSEDIPEDTFDEAALSTRFQSLYMKLENETALREETEKHLRITRKALYALEAESRDYESAKADSIIDLEEKLAQSINLQIESETIATLEKDQRIKAETNVVNLKQSLVKTKHEIRRSAAARAKALSTANKAIAFARQTLQIRARLESELEQTKETLANRQKTISSLIRALEKEKRHTQEEVLSVAKQLVLHEKQLQARRSLEEVARSVETKLTSRLVKKVAKARPLIPDH